MTVRAKGNRGLADVLVSRIVRSRGRCQFPACTSDGPYDCAHIIGRAYSATRCLEDNLWCLCRTHHVEVDNWPHKKMELVGTTIGELRYYQLNHRAKGGHPFSAALFWADEVIRLKARCIELGLSSKRSAA